MPECDVFLLLGVVWFKRTRQCPTGLLAIFVSNLGNNVGTRVDLDI